MKKFEPQAAVTLRGISASPGIAIGRVFVVANEHHAVERRTLAPDDIPKELERFHCALDKTKEELVKDREIAEGKMGGAGAEIFEVQRVILEDPVFIPQVEAAIRDQAMNAEFAFDSLMCAYVKQLTEKGGWMAERSADFHELIQRVLRNLQGDRRDLLNQFQGTAIVVTGELKPSTAVLLDRHKIRGFATDVGGKTSHAAILVHSYGVPAVVGLREITSVCKPDDRIIVDGFEGLVLVNPDEETVARYQKKLNKWQQRMTKLGHLRELPARTLDGRDIELAANLEFADEVKLVHANGAQGVGLLRTEYLYFGRREPPTEDEQFQEYYRIASEVKPHPVIIRTMDLGGDKSPECLEIPPEANPFLGWRAIRICLEMPELFKSQIKAILRANVLGNVKILLPMISGIQELEEALAIVQQSKVELGKSGKSFEPDTPLGVMIEVPSAAILADFISERVNFLSIGTNDLVQYSLAVDRGNDRIAHLFTSLHPAVLRLMKSVISAGHSRGVWVGTCGEMAADRLATLLLVGMEIDELSVSPIDVPEIKRIIRSIHYREAQELVARVMEFPTSQEIQDYLRTFMRRRFKDIMI